MRFLKVPENCPLQIKLGDGFFAQEDIRLPVVDDADWRTLELNRKSIVLPSYIHVKLPNESVDTQFYFFQMGSFNAVFTNFRIDQFERYQLPKTPILLKIQITDSKLDAADRAERVFNEANKTALDTKIKSDPEFFGYTKKFGNACLMPFIPGKKSTTEEIRTLVIESERILLDAYVHGNCLTDNENTVWIVDTGFALQLRSKNPEQVARLPEDAISEASFRAYYGTPDKQSPSYRDMYKMDIFKKYISSDIYGKIS